MNRSGKHVLMALSLAAVCAAAACDGASDAGGDQPLARGARGPEVEAAYAYLQAFGYFPNEQLAARYPSWRPIVAEAPANHALLDERMELALKTLQRNIGLPVTGALDAATIAFMAEPRCGNPDIDLHAEARTDKWAILGPQTRWTKNAITYRFANPNGTITNFPNASALRSLNQLVDQDMGERHSAHVHAGHQRGDFIISYADIPTPGSTAPLPNPDIIIDSIWSDWTSARLQNAVIHEMGHVIGLNHVHV